MKKIASPGNTVKALATTGLIAKGIVYCLTGTITLMAAFNIKNVNASQADKGGLFAFLYEQPFGKLLLYIIAAGLVCYAIWRIIQAILDTEQKGSDLKGLFRRGVYIFSGLVYASLAFLAVKIALHKSSGSGNSKQNLAQQLLDKPFGVWLMAAVAIGMIAVGINQGYRAFSGKYKKYVEQGRINNNKAKALLIKCGKVGYVSRGIVWLIVGWLFLKAAFHSNPKEAGNSGNAFRWIEIGAFGEYLLAAISVGLICYGVYMFVRAKYQPIHLPR